MGYWLNMLTHFEDEFLTLPNLDFITAHSIALSLHKWAPILGPGSLDRNYILLQLNSSKNLLHCHQAMHAWEETGSQLQQYQWST